MITLTTEEAIKELSRYTNPEFYTHQNREAHRMAIEALEGNQWIPVGERLPEESGWCLAFSEQGNWHALHYSARHKAFNAFDELRNDAEVRCSHWMPLPDSPGKDGAV